ncbi:MAG: hypothetical protein HQ592_16255 [Planctomycetes bacterium]|nr:hypothetical protein [Planctomycetota bacterium]
MPETQVLSSATPRAGPRRRWARFLTGLLGIMLFAFGAIPALERLGPVREVRDATRKAGIDATALFYTESDVSGEAEASIRNAITYSARRKCASSVARQPRTGRSSGTIY